MKNLKKPLKLLSIMLLLILVSCKKNEITSSNQLKPLDVKELLNYYIVAEHATGPNKLLVIYFTQNGNKVMANAHLQGYFRQIEVTVENGSFKIDYNNDGKSVYSFNLERDVNGNLGLRAYDFMYNGANGQLSFAAVAKTAEAYDFVHYQYTANPFLSIQPNNFRFDFDDNPYTYYKLSNVGFKSDNDLFMCATVPRWKDDKKVILLEKVDKLYAYTLN